MDALSVLASCAVFLQTFLSVFAQYGGGQGYNPWLWQNQNYQRNPPIYDASNAFNGGNMFNGGAFPQGGAGGEFLQSYQAAPQRSGLEGPNVCSVEEVTGANIKYYTECKSWKRNEQICGRPTKIVYECCAGYQEVAGEIGCTGVIPLVNIIATARRYGASKFTELVTKANLLEELTTRGAFTAFVPSNDALSAADQQTLDRMTPNPVERRQSLLLYHVVPRKVFMIDMKHFRAEKTKMRFDKVRFATYANGMLTVNCAKLLKPNEQAKNGIVHIIDRVLVPPVGTISDVISQDGRFNQLRSALSQSGLSSVLSGEGPFTLLAPTDDAFRSLKPGLLDKIISDPDALASLLKMHLLDSYTCSAAVVGKTEYLKTMSGRDVNITCGLRGLSIGNARVVQADLVTTNGVIHVIDQVLLTPETRSMTEVAAELGLNSFVRYLDMAGLKMTIDNGGPFTIFAPTDSAFNNLPEKEREEMLSKRGALSRVIGLHVTNGKKTSTDVIGDQVVRSIDKPNYMRLHVYRHTFAAESSCIRTRDHVARNGVIHVIDKVIVPPKHTIAELLELDDRFSTLRDALTKSNMMEEFKKPDQRYTLFAPDDEAFKRLPIITLDRLQLNPDDLREVLRNHIMEEVYVGCSFRDHNVYPLLTLLGEKQYVSITGGTIHIGQASVVKSDVMATNGVIHIVDNVLMPQK